MIVEHLQRTWHIPLEKNAKRVLYTPAQYGGPALPHLQTESVLHRISATLAAASRATEHRPFQWQPADNKAAEEAE
eukprot:2894466-Amphidinium_carterae.1